MPKFAYVTRNAQGERAAAVGEAATRQNLLANLAGSGLTVVELQELKESGEASSEIKRLFQFKFSLGRITTSDLAFFWRQFAAMIAAGLPIIEALESISQELENAKLKKILDQIIHDMWEGLNLSRSMSKHPKVFSMMVVALIGAAEESGSLSEITNQIATFLENRDRLFRKVIAALTYPIFVVGFFICVLGVANFWIIPAFRDIYTGFDAKLPWITEVVFAANAFFLRYFIWIIAGFVALTVALVQWARKPQGRAVIDRLVFKLPVFGKLMQRAAVARFARSLGILLFGGIAISRALEMAAETAGNSVMAKAINQTREDILKGGKIGASLKKQSVFPRMAVRMISAGEETGNLTPLLEKTAEFYETLVDATLTTINTLIEPIIIILIGIFVLIFVLALYMPIFSLGQAIHRA